jgi:hypothetical protein
MGALTYCSATLFEHRHLQSRPARVISTMMASDPANRQLNSRPAAWIVTCMIENAGSGALPSLPMHVHLRWTTSWPSGPGACCTNE